MRIPRELPIPAMRVFAVIVITVKSHIAAEGKTSGVLSLDENSRGNVQNVRADSLGYPHSALREPALIEERLLTHGLTSLL